MFEGAGRRAGPVIHGPDEIAAYWGKGTKAPLIKDQPRVVVEVAADAALQDGHFRPPSAVPPVASGLAARRSPDTCS
ncbi:MAG: hypothetical protein QOF10_3460 [Kribbellaceae bacterium]|nr:hypothetical protein [Kribbellaceae bacterium]